MSTLTRRKFLAYGAGFGCTVLGLSRPRTAGQVRVAVAGLDDRHLRALSSVNNVHIAAIHDRPNWMTDAARVLPTRLPPPAAYSDFRCMLEEARIDMLVASGPQELRMCILEEAARAGKSLVLEAPAVVTLEEAAELEELAKRFPISIGHISSDWEWDREELATVLSLGQRGPVNRIEIEDMAAISKPASPTLSLDIIEAALQVLSASRPRRVIVLTGGELLAWNLSAEIELESQGERRQLGLHVGRRALPDGMDRSITFHVQGSRGTMTTKVECWRGQEAEALPSIAWARAVFDAHVGNRERWGETTQRTLAACAVAEFVRAAWPGKAGSRTNRI